MNLFGTKKGYYKLFRAIYSNNFYSNNYIEYESNGDKNKALSIKQYVDEIKPYFEDIIINLKNLTVHGKFN